MVATEIARGWTLKAYNFGAHTSNLQKSADDANTFIRSIIRHPKNKLQVYVRDVQVLGPQQLPRPRVHSLKLFQNNFNIV